METLFESFVTHHVRKNFADSFTVTAQAGGKFLFDVSKACKLRPDILLTGDDPLKKRGNSWCNPQRFHCQK